jgi:hypothetical protein
LLTVTRDEVLGHAVMVLNPSDGTGLCNSHREKQQPVADHAKPGRAVHSPVQASARNLGLWPSTRLPADGCRLPTAHSGPPSRYTPTQATKAAHGSKRGVGFRRISPGRLRLP